MSDCKVPLFCKWCGSRLIVKDHEGFFDECTGYQEKWQTLQCPNYEYKFRPQLSYYSLGIKRYYQGELHMIGNYLVGVYWQDYLSCQDSGKSIY